MDVYTRTISIRLQTYPQNEAVYENIRNWSSWHVNRKRQKCVNLFGLPNWASQPQVCMEERTESLFKYLRTSLFNQIYFFNEPGDFFFQN